MRGQSILERFGRDLSMFVWACLSAWQAYLTGGAVQAIVNIYERQRGQSILWSTYRWGALAFLVAAFFVVWRRTLHRAEDAEEKLRPRLDVVYDRENSLINEEGETYRLRLINNGVTAIDGVEVRIEEAPTLTYLRGFLPTILREQHRTTGTALMLKGGTPRFIDFLEYSEAQSASRVNDGTQLVSFCRDFDNGGLGGGFRHEGEHVIVIEASGRDVPPCRKSFLVKSLLPNHAATGDTIEIRELL